MRGCRRPSAARRIAELLGIMNLTEHADKLPRELSGGMRQRVAIGRALAPEPDVLLLDEPFAALDAQTRRSMQDFLLTMWRRTRCTIVMVTHDVEEAIYLAGRIFVMSSRPGRIAEEVTVPFGDAPPTCCTTRGSWTSAMSSPTWSRRARSLATERGSGARFRSVSPPSLPVPPSPALRVSQI